MICVCESEIVLYQLYLYTRRIYPDLAFEEGALRAILKENGIRRMKQLFALDSGGKRKLAEAVLRKMPVQQSMGGKAEQAA